ncbi:MAG: S46 family peptidase, partial [Arenimonas sp.]|nr:S46 family peptidase [Arenimonas sp.]
MWVPQQLPEIAGPLRAAGLQLDPAQLASLTGDPMGAVVALGGCTASFVSPDGLVVTNHHCAYGSIQLNSTAERNLMADGFVAATRADEPSAGPAARVFVMDQITDVTEQVLAATAPDMDGLALQKAIESAQKSLIAACESEPGFRCTLYGFYGGQTYRLFRQIEIKDVRLVYAPPGAIGNYGGEVDNWMWPRHTGDFAFYRAYVGKDGKPAAYSPDNVPFRPRHHLKMAGEGLAAGDFVMVAGYPGSTSRYALFDEFQSVAEWQYPVFGGHVREVVALMEAAGKANPDIEVKYAANLRGWQNAMKNWEGQLEGFRRIGAAQQKREDEEAVLAWLRTRGAEGQPALDAHAELVALAAQARQTRERDAVLGQFAGTGLLGNVRGLYRLASEREKPNAERSPGYQDRDLPGLEANVRQLERRYDPTMEKQLLAYWLTQYQTLPASQRVPAVDAWLG